MSLYCLVHLIVLGQSVDACATAVVIASSNCCSCSMLRCCCMLQRQPQSCANCCRKHQIQWIIRSAAGACLTSILRFLQYIAASASDAKRWCLPVQEAEEASYVHKIQVVQWTVASKRSHPVVCRMGAAIKAFVEQEAADGYRFEQDKGHDASILLRTGPGIWSTEVQGCGVCHCLLTCVR